MCEAMRETHVNVAHGPGACILEATVFPALNIYFYFV